MEGLAALHALERYQKKMPTARNESDWRKHREMSNELRRICVEAVGTCAEIPTAARENKDAVGSVEISTYDQSYIEFLDSQITLAARGLEWNDRLRIRRDHLSQYVGRELARCRLQFRTQDYSIYIDPIEGSVVHWEVYDETGGDNIKGCSEDGA
jgi:hypothetical protein